jgi:signal transduction histidine kinase/ActR/RegA family two-component response regulator
LRLRTKFMVSLAVVTAGLTWATLSVVRSTAEGRVQREIQEESQNAMVTFQVLQHGHLVALMRKADLLASLVMMRNGDPASIEDVGKDPWHSDECDLLVFSDASGKIVALHTTMDEFPQATAQELLGRALTERNTTAWWYSGTRLYQVFLKPVYSGTPSKGNLLGTVVVGHGIDPQATELRRVSASHVAFRYGNDIVASTLPLFKQQEFASQLRSEPWKERVTLDSEKFFVSSVELTGGAKPVSIIVLKSYNDSLAYLEKQNQLLGALGILAVVVGGVLVFVISDRFTRPLARLFEGVRALEKGDFSYPVAAEGSDEVAHVTRAFDRMRKTLKSDETQKEQLQEQLRQAQKMEAVGRLAGGVAHDFNNLLTIIKGHGDLMLEKLQPSDPLQRNANQIEKAANRAASLTRQLLAFSRMQVLEPKVLDLNVLVAEMCSLLKRLVREDISFTFKAGESLGRVKADPGQIEQVIMNLTVNACDAMPTGGKLTVETRNVFVDEAFAKNRPPLLPGEYIGLTVEDTGHGMDAATRERIFEPFFTTKEMGKGTGLGLATVYGVVKQSGGCIWVESEPGTGTRFEVYLPAAREAVESAIPEGTPKAAAHHSGAVLIVEDEEAVRELAAEFMTSAGYKVLTARDGREALEVAKRSGPIRVLVTDIVMPNMRGPELAKNMKASRRDLKVIFMSGYLEFNKGGDEFVEGSYFLQKPFSRDTLVSKVDEALRQKRAAGKATTHQLV